MRGREDSPSTLPLTWRPTELFKKGQGKEQTISFPNKLYSIEFSAIIFMASLIFIAMKLHYFRIVLIFPNSIAQVPHGILENSEVSQDYHSL